VAARGVVPLPVETTLKGARMIVREFKHRGCQGSPGFQTAGWISHHCGCRLRWVFTFHEKRLLPPRTYISPIGRDKKRHL